MGTVEHTYRHGIDAVFAKLSDPEHLRRRAAAAGHRNIDVKVEDRDGRIEIRVARDIESDIPSFAKKVVDATNHVVDTIEWRTQGDEKVGSYRVEVSPRIRLRGQLALKPVPGGCKYVDTFTATVDVPLIGGKIAQIVERETATAIRADCERTARELG